MDPIHQEEARDLSSFLECVPVKVIDHSGHILPLTVVVRDKSGRKALDVFNFSSSSFLVSGFHTVQQYSKCGRTSEM